VPKVTEAYRDARRSEITDAALRCFSAKGFHRTSMADIIREAGLSAGAIYGHFPSKEALLASVAERVLSSRSTELEQQAQESPLSPSDIFTVLIRGFRAETFDTSILLQVWGEAVTNPAVRGVLQDVMSRVRATLRPHLRGWAAANPDRAGDDPDAYADRILPVLMGLLPGFVLQRAIVPGFDEDAFVAELAALLPR
jgi:AcrR family transcriptional regulator